MSKPTRAPTSHSLAAPVRVWYVDSTINMVIQPAWLVCQRDMPFPLPERVDPHWTVVDQNGVVLTTSHTVGASTCVFPTDADALAYAKDWLRAKIAGVDLERAQAEDLRLHLLTLARRRLHELEERD